eukprot:644947-Prymnesium_polylepis.1
MYLILQKLDNIERALHRYDETRQVSFDTVLKFCRLLWTGRPGRKTVSFSFNDINLDLISHNEAQCRVNASRKKEDGNICTATLNIDIPHAPAQEQMDNPDLPAITAAAQLISSKIDSLYT